MRSTLRLDWLALIVNVGVIAMGALVRATESGAGCGRSWPTCQGAVVPAELSGATLVEFSHRATSGLALVAVVSLFVMAALAERRSPVRFIAALTATPLSRATGWAVIAVFVEALIGAAIVLFEWVVHDSSLARIVAVPLHLVNTLLLLAALASAVAIARGQKAGQEGGGTLRSGLRRPVLFGFAAMVVTAGFGAVAALADTLFPTDSVISGVVDDFTSQAELLTRLRVLHPIIAVATGIALVRIVSSRGIPETVRTGRWAKAVVGLVMAQVVAGVINIVLLTPVWMQLVHLVMADALWISFVWFAFDLSAGHSRVASSSTDSTGAEQTLSSQT